MIPFFRKIRKKMADDNRPLMYMRYAIGEIILVVIGILIALSINNWNIANQETKELHSYLKSIKKNLQADLISLEEIIVYRDSSILYSKNYLEVAKKEMITIEDFNSIMNSDYNVFYDQYFQSKKSGFEALKNSGYIGKLHSTNMGEKLNEYYYLIDKVDEQESSLSNTVENMENGAFSTNTRQGLVELHLKNNKEEYFAQNQVQIKQLLNQPYMTGANYRYSSEVFLPMYYRKIEQLGMNIILEIDSIIED